MTIKVIGAGFGRTGTMSIKVALEELGFNRCYHMHEIVKNPGRAKLWYEASQGKPINWAEIFRGYQATVDWPGCSFYQELMEQYPQAKVLLTVRNPERWYESMFNTIYAHSPKFPTWLSRLVPFMRYIPALFDNLIWNGTFHGKFEDKQYAINIFNQHIAEVKRIVPAERLLIYEVQQGWEPLCRFLDVPIPQDKPFPHLNDSPSFKKMIRRRSLAMQLAPSFIIMLIVLIIGWMLASIIF